MHGPLNFDSIPSAFKTLRLFLCWKYGTPQTNGKKSKIPIDKSGRAISPTDPKLWRSCYEAIGQFEAGHADGIGIAITRDNGCIGIDLDHSVTDGVIEQWALAIMETCPSTYWEYSPSASGLHGFVKGTLPIGHATKKGNVEVYSDKRYLTFTGNRLPDAGHEIQPATDAFYQWFGETFAPAPTPVTKRILAPLRAIGRDDAVLIAKIRTSAKGETFSALFDGKDISTDDSKNDMELCGILSYWTIKNAEQIDSIFRASALYREKWDTKRGDSTYGQRTISKAIACCTKTYDPNWKKAEEKGGETQKVCGAVACILSENPALDGLPVTLLPMGASISSAASPKEVENIVRALYRGHHRVVNRDRFRIGDACAALGGNSETKAKQLRRMGFNEGDIQFFNTCAWVAGQFPNHADREAEISWSAFTTLAKKEFTQSDRARHIERKSTAKRINLDRTEKRAQTAAPEPVTMSSEEYALELFRQWQKQAGSWEAIIPDLRSLVEGKTIVNNYENEEETTQENEQDSLSCVYPIVYPLVAHYQNDSEHYQNESRHISREADLEEERSTELRSLDDDLYLEFGALIDKADCNALLTEYVLADGSTVDMNLLAERAFDQRDQAQLEFIDQIVHSRYTNRKELLACAIVTSSQTPSSLFNPSATVLPPFNQPVIESHCLSMAT